mmetsp:Transcript_88104/g.254159  ORF Transcript_88104/g.254159 Transcript_88104/m.254159 type:complete len:234 (+) Transcript_88104:226-927(+)
MAPSPRPRSFVHHTTIRRARAATRGNKGAGALRRYTNVPSAARSTPGSTIARGASAAAHSRPASGCAPSKRSGWRWRDSSTSTPHRRGACRSCFIVAKKRTKSSVGRRDRSERPLRRLPPRPCRPTASPPWGRSRGPILSRRQETPARATASSAGSSRRRTPPVAAMSRPAEPDRWPRRLWRSRRMMRRPRWANRAPAPKTMGLRPARARRRKGSAPQGRLARNLARLQTRPR